MEVHHLVVMDMQLPLMVHIGNSKNPLLEGPQPHVREGASMVAIGDKIMIFGGQGTRQRFNDLYILDAK